MTEATFSGYFVDLEEVTATFPFVNYISYTSLRIIRMHFNIHLEVLDFRKGYGSYVAELGNGVGVKGNIASVLDRGECPGMKEGQVGRVERADVSDTGLRPSKLPFFGPVTSVQL